MTFLSSSPLLLLLVVSFLMLADKLSLATTEECSSNDDAKCNSGGEVVGSGGTIGIERTQKDYYQKASHYDTLWGQDNLHIGYFPHLDKNTDVVLNPSQAALALTERMIKIASIGPTDKVLDLGSGK